MDDSRWHILRVTSGSEDRVALECGYTCYVPRQLIKKFNRRLRRVVQYFQPLYPGHVFINIDEVADFKAKPDAGRLGFMRNGDGTASRLTRRSFVELLATEKHFCIPTNATGPRFVEQLSALVENNGDGPQRTGLRLHQLRDATDAVAA